MAKQDILKKTEDRIWLVKSADTILGPYTVAELAQGVRDKEIGLLDEARTPNNRWLFVRDIPEIQSTISKLAQTEDTFEKTHTAASGSITVTRNISDEATPVPLQVPIAKQNIVPPKVTSSDSAYTKPVTPAAETSPVKSYSVNPPSEPIPWTKWGLFAFVALSFVVALFSFIQRKTWESDQRKTWSEFQQYYVAQLYDQAYKKLKEFQREFPDQPTALTRAGFLYLNPGRELVNARRMFEKSSHLDPNNKELMIQNLNGLGLVSLYEGQLVQAKSYFDRAITLEPGNILTRLNLISLNMSQGLWDEAYALAQQIYTSEPKKSLLIESTLALLSPQHADRGKPTLAALAKTVDNSSYLRPIMRLMMMKLASLYSDALALDIQIKNFFDDLPSLHLEFSETPLIDQRWRDWNFLYQFCNDIKAPASLEGDILAVQIVCISQIQKWSEAEKIANEGLKRFPGNQRIFLAQLHMLTLMERWPEVRALMKTASLTTDTATNWMFAKACIKENNKSCAALYLNPLMQKSIVPTAVYVLQAESVCTEKVSDSCRFAITQGLAQDPFTATLLKFKYQIEAGYDD